MFETYATKLGVNTPLTIRKAKEYMQKLEIHGGLSTLNIASSCVQVICLELAACTTSQTADRMTAIKLSGVNKRTYISSLKAVETMLDLTQDISIRDLTVQFGCTSVQSLAEKILDRYTEEHSRESESGVDFGSTMFKCAAVCAACKVNKIKIARTKLYEMSAVKRNVFERLASEMERVSDKLIDNTQKTKKKSTSKSLMDRVYANMQENDSSAANVGTDATPPVDFDEWKRRILEQTT